MPKECVRSQFGLSWKQPCAASGGKPIRNAKLFVCVKESICQFGSLITVAMSKMPKVKYISMMELSLLVVNARVFYVIFYQKDSISLESSFSVSEFSSKAAS